MPHVVVHNAVSLDGRIDGFDADVGTHYDLAGRFDSDAHLVGTDTLIDGLAGGAGDASAADVGGGAEESDAGAPALVVPDSRGRVADWAAVRAQPFWGRVVVLCSEVTPASYLAGLEEQDIPYYVVGQDHVDYGRAFDRLAEHDGFETVLVDSGGTLSGYLLRAGLVDEVSLLVHPTVVGGTSARPFFRGPEPGADGATTCSLWSTDRLDGGLLWLRYEVEHG